MAMMIATPDDFTASMTQTSEGSLVRSYDDPVEMGVQIERLNGQIIGLLAMREYWDLTGFVACAYAAPEDDTPTLGLVEMNLEELLTMQESKDYSRVLGAFSLTGDEQQLFHEVMENL
jgi:hypothetical protein